MEASLFTCPICYQDFDSTRVPKIIPACGHTICSDCVAKIKNNPDHSKHKCPFDKAVLPQSIDSCPKNFSLVRIIEGRVKVDTCEIHNHKPVNYVCLTEKKGICSLCYKEHNKKQHNLVPIEVIESQFTEIIKQIHAFLEDIKTYHENLKLKLQQNHQRQIESIKSEFKKLRAFIDEKEAEMIFESKCCLAIKESKLETIFGKNSQMFTKFSELRVELENTLSHKNYFREDFSEEIMARIQDYKLKMDHNNLILEEAETDLEFNHFEKLIMNVLEDFKRSLDNGKMPGLFDNLDKIITTFSAEETKEVNIYDQDRDISTFMIKSNLIIEYSQGVLTINNNKQNLSYILVDLEKWNSFHTIQLNLEYNISEEDFHLLSLIWKRSSNPSTLEIIITPNTLTDKLHNALLEKISTKSKLLKEISLDMSNLDLSNQSLKNFFKNFDLKNLEALSLNFGCTNINDKDLLPLFVKMPNLRRFVLKMSRTQITDQTLEECGQINFIPSPFLEEITLHAEGTHITDLGVQNFLSNLKNLKKLDLNLSNTHITDKTVYLLSQKLSKSPMIEDFEVWLENTKISDLNFTLLFKALSNVKSFILNLGGTEISDNTLETFSRDTLLSMKNIQTLILYLWGTKITDGQVVEIFANIPDVEKLEIDLRGTKITDASIEPFLTKKLPLLTKLNDLHIKLEETDVSEEIIDQVYTAMDQINHSS